MRRVRGRRCVPPRGTSRARSARRPGRSTTMSAASWRREREQLLVGRRRGSRGPTRSAVGASTKLPVTLISRARRRPIASASSTVSPQPGMIPTRAWVSAKRARSEATRKSHVERDLEAAGDRDAVDRADERLGASRGTAAIERRRRRSAPTWRASASVPSSFRSTPAQNAGSAPVRTMASTSSRASHAAIASGSAAVQRAGSSALRASGRLRVTTATPVAHVDQDHVVVAHVPTVLSIAARASRRTRPCLRGCRRWRGWRRWR